MFILIRLSTQDHIPDSNQDNIIEMVFKPNLNKKENHRI